MLFYAVPSPGYQLVPALDGRQREFEPAVRTLLYVYAVIVVRQDIVHDIERIRYLS